MKRHLIYLLFPALLLSGCISDKPFVEPQGGDLRTTLTLKVPAGGFKPVETRAMDDTDENTIRQVDVLVFEKASAGAADNTALFFERAEVDLAGSGADMQSFGITVKKSTKPLQFVVLAGCRALVDAKAAAFVAGTTTRSDALDALVMSTSGAWNAATAAYDPLPMWGQTAFRTITTAASAAATIDMVRAHARIDVTVAAAAQAAFKLSSVRLYNPSRNGRIAPSGVWTSGTTVLPASLDAAASPFVFSTMTTADKALAGTIYTFEAPAATAANQTTAPFLVVGGSWNGEAETFYRIDFSTTANNTTTFMPLLRNYHYEVDITGVAGRGFSSPDAAKADSFTDRITTNVHQWAQGQMGTVVWDGKDWLAVSDTRFDLFPEARDIEIKIATTVPSWSAQVPASAAWLTIASGGSGTGSATNPPVGTLTLDVAENTVADREAVVTITAGRLQQKITVRQSLTKELALELGDLEMIFSAANPQPAPLRVEWAPGAIDCTVSNAAASGYTALSFSPALQPVHDAAALGSVNYSIKPSAFTPPANNPFQERRSVLTITANDGLGHSLAKTVTLRQLNPAILVTGMRSGNTYEQETSYTLTVRSNGEWEVVESDPDGVIVSVSTPVGEPNTAAAGETVTFRTGDRTHHGQSATLTFRHKDDPTVKQDVTVKIKENEANCYIVRPGEGQTIHLTKVFELWATDPDLSSATYGDPSAMAPGSSYTVSLLWQDTPGLLAAADIGNLTLDHTGKTGSFTVQTTAGQEGNAVVVLKEGATIRWSWHIWICDFDPDENPGFNRYRSTTVMDRNLGATSTTPGDIRANGFFYQWGRKDPFPGDRSYTSSSNGYDSAPIYDVNNVQLTEDAGAGGTGVKKTPVAAPRNLKNAIENPLTFYQGTSNNYNDWFSNADHSNGTQPVVGTPSHRNNLWGATKTAFDPCPDGWKIPLNGMIGDYVKPAPKVNYGLQLEQIGYVPLSGYRTAAGVLNGSRGWDTRFASYYAVNTYNASATMMANQQHGGVFSDNTAGSGSYSAYAMGLSVRCVKIQ